MERKMNSKPVENEGKKEDVDSSPSHAEGTLFLCVQTIVSLEIATQTCSNPQGKQGKNIRRVGWVTRA